MKKSELKRYILEALTPDEAAKVEPKYKETYAAMIKGKGPLKLKKYDNPDAVVRGRVVNTIKNESLKLAEKLGKTANVGDYKDDFRKSDAPQFKGKSKKKRDQMATAAFLNKEDQNLDEEISNVDFLKHADRVENLLRQLISATNKVDSSQDDTEEDVEQLDQSIDYLSAALTDKDPIDIAVDQATFGRLAKPTKEEKTLEEIDAMMEESAYKAGRKAKEEKLPVNDIKKAIKALLKKEGGAAGLAPILKLAKDFDNVTQIDVEDILDNDMKDVEKHRDGDYILKETGQEIATKNMNMYKDKNRLEEFVKAALMKETSTDKYDDNPALKGKQSELPDGLQKAIIKKSGGKVDEIKERILKELRGSINEMAGEDLELKSLAKKFIPILKKYGMKVDYETDTKSIEMKPKVGPQGVPAKLLIRKQDDDKGGQFGMLTVAVYWLELVSAKKDRRLDLKELDFVPPSPETYDIADEMANKIYKELMAVVPKGEFDSITPPKMNRWGNYLIHFRLKK